MSATEITLERNTANDESAVIVAIFVPSGTEVADDELIAEFENSKTTQELRAPIAGILVHQLEIGQEVPFGVPIARIVGAGESLEMETTGALPAAPAQVVTASPEPASVMPESEVLSGEAPVKTPPRFSHEALVLLQKFHIEPSTFETGLITAAQVLARLPGHASPPAVPLITRFEAAAKSSLGVAKDTVPGQTVDRRKQAEIDTLLNGAGGTLLSVLGKTLGPIDMWREPEDVFNGRITDLVIYEASRLMKKFPKLNASFADGRIILHESVHAGIAMDSGGRLVVYGIENADQVTMPAIGSIVTEAVGRYMNNELTASELTRATFTVTDLSADDLDFVLPLLPRGQSCIIGITHDAASGFRLFAGFDHRVTEGREVSAFLAALGERVISFTSAAPAMPNILRCEFCAKSMGEAVGRAGDKGLLSVVDRKGATVLCCAGCWNGW